MHKKLRADKKTGARNRHLTESDRGAYSRNTPRKPRSINELLTHRDALRHLVDAIPVTESWLAWLRAALPAELAAHLVGVIAKPPALVVLADGAAWAARLRYALAARQAGIRARDGSITRTVVRLQPDARPDAGN